MVEILWTVLALCGFAIIVYGVFLFFALPAAGVFVATTGLVIVNVSLRRTALLNEGLNVLRKRRPKGRDFRTPDQLGRQTDTIGEKIPIVKSYKIVAFFLFVTNRLSSPRSFPTSGTLLGARLDHWCQVVCALWLPSYTRVCFSRFSDLLSHLRW